MGSGQGLCRQFIGHTATSEGRCASQRRLGGQRAGREPSPSERSPLGGKHGFVVSHGHAPSTSPCVQTGTRGQTQGHAF